MATLRLLSNPASRRLKHDKAGNPERHGNGFIVDHNRQIFERPDIVQYYAQHGDLTPAEDEIFHRYKNNYESKRVLDLGVGGGRTTYWLALSSASYVGIDYSVAMVTRCRQRFPRHHFEHGDARDLSSFGNNAFDFVMFAFNGIDFVDNADRAQVLREVARVLTPGGIYAFSTHSLDNRTALTICRGMLNMPQALSWLSLIKGSARIGLRLANYVRRYRMQVRGNGYAILLDPGHDFTLPIYHVSTEEQKRQLEAAGFELDCRLPEHEASDLAQNRRPYSHYYVAR